MQLLNKYECARVLGLRYLQLQQSSGALPPGNLRAFVLDELLEGNNTLCVRRTFPDGTHEDWRVCDLEIPDDLRELLLYNRGCIRE